VKTEQKIPILSVDFKIDYDDYGLRSFTDVAGNASG